MARKGGVRYSNTNVNPIAKNVQIGDVLLNTRRQYMTRLNCLAGNAVNNFLGGEILLNTKEKYMKVPSTLAGIVENNFHLRVVSLAIKG